MGFYLLKRLTLMIPLFIGITIISFGVIHLAPGSPIDMATDLNPKATAEVKAKNASLIRAGQAPSCPVLELDEPFGNLRFRRLLFPGWPKGLG